MKKIRKSEWLPLSAGVVQIIIGCLIGGFWGGAFFGGGVLYILTYTIGKYIYDKAERRNDQIMKNILNLQNDVRDGNPDSK